MKKLGLLIGLLALIYTGLFAQGRTYNVGDVGPGGGYVFYDKGQVSDGWRYLEAAPEETEFRNVQWGRNRDVPGTLTGIGRGQANTALIVEVLDAARERGRAAQLCVSLEHNGFDDWFLPSKDELNLMFLNLRQRGLGGFTDDRYWSSTQEDRRDAWNQNFNTSPIYAVWFFIMPGDQSKNGKQDSYKVRAVRAF